MFQVGVVLLAAAGFFFGKNAAAAVAALGGGGISLILVLLLGRSMRRASALAQTDARAGMVILYVGAVQRFVAVLVLIGAAIVLGKADPLALLVGFACGQIGNVVSAQIKKNTGVKP